MSEELAWAAGLFDGEGSISLTGSGRFLLQVKMCDRECVARFAGAVGMPGRVLGPYKNRTGEKDGYQRSDFYLWTSKVGSASGVLGLLWPWLSETRRGQAVALGYANVHMAITGGLR